MRKGKFIRVLQKYELRNENGIAMQLQDYAAAIQEAVQEAIPDWGVDIYDDHIIVENAGSKGFKMIEEAMAKRPILSDLRLSRITTYFRDADGNPFRGKEHFRALAAAENQSLTKEFETMYGPDADEDDYVDWQAFLRNTHFPL